MARNDEPIIPDEVPETLTEKEILGRAILAQFDERVMDLLACDSGFRNARSEIELALQLLEDGDITELNRILADYCTPL